MSPPMPSPIPRSGEKRAQQNARFFDTRRAAPFAGQRMYSNSVQKSMQG